jgi:hypothetical protein
MSLRAHLALIRACAEERLDCGADQHPADALGVQLSRAQFTSRSGLGSSEVQGPRGQGAAVQKGAVGAKPIPMQRTVARHVPPTVPASSGAASGFASLASRSSLAMLAAIALCIYMGWVEYVYAISLATLPLDFYFHGAAASTDAVHSTCKTLKNTAMCPGGYLLLAHSVLTKLPSGNLIRTCEHCMTWVFLGAPAIEQSSIHTGIAMDRTGSAFGISHGAS